MLNSVRMVALAMTLTMAVVGLTACGRVGYYSPAAGGIDGGVPGDIADGGGPGANPRARYRSVGFGSTAPLGVGSASNTLEVRASIATFASATESSIGIGDVLQYDASGDGTIDSIAFVHERLGTSSFFIRGADGSLPADTVTTTTDTWRLCRAYASLQAANDGTENTECIDDAVEEFDPGKKDVVASDELYFFALYADAPHTTPATNGIAINSWTTDAAHPLFFLVPKWPSEVGTSQRHAGIWDDTKFLVNRTTGLQISIHDGIDANFIGLQLENRHNGAGMPTLIVRESQTGYQGRTIVTNSIIRLTGTGTSAMGLTCESNTNCVFVNNIIYNFDTASSRGIASTASASLLAYNNTVVNASEGITYSGANDILFNNLVQSTTGRGFADAALLASGNNISGDDSSPNVAFRNRTATFVNADTGDFRLAPTDIAAIDQGADLSTAESFGFAIDIAGTARVPPWDVGAFETPPGL